jgi:3,4-dihydroxy-2-butanone 4-phosphate synthase
MREIALMEISFDAGYGNLNRRCLPDLVDRFLDRQYMGEELWKEIRLVMKQQLDVFCDVGNALAELRAGRVLVIADDDRPGSQAHLVTAMDTATTSLLRVMASIARGLMCFATEQKRPQFITFPARLTNALRLGASFGVGREELANDLGIVGSRVKQIPVVPLTVRRRGALDHLGHAEALVGLARLADLSPTGFLCKMMFRSSPTQPLVDIARRHHYRIITVSEWLKYRTAANINIEFSNRKNSGKGGRFAEARPHPSPNSFATDVTVQPYRSGNLP